MKTTDQFKKDYGKRVVASTRKPSLFVPDMGIELKDLILKVAQGVAPDVQQKGEYSEDPDFDDLALTPDMDLTDLADLQAQVNIIKNKHSELLSKREKEKQEKLFNDEVEKRLQERIKNAEPVKPE